MRAPRTLFSVAALICSMQLSAASALVNQITPELEARLVDLFSNHRCPEIAEILPLDQIPFLRPNIQAVVASCGLPGIDSEVLFLEAEKRNPSGDLIAVLHARYRSRVNPPSATVLWEKVLEIARHPFLRKMAIEYLSGITDATEDADFSLNSKYTYFGNLRVGGGRQSNPKDPVNPPPATRSSDFSQLTADFSVQRWLNFGSLAATLDVSHSKYFSVSELDALNTSLELPFSIHAGTYEDIIFCHM